MPILTQDTYIGKGEVFVRRRGATGAARVPIGNTTELSFAVEEEKKELLDYTAGGGGVIDTVTRIKAVNGTAKVTNLSVANLALAVRGQTTANSGTAPITGETVAAGDVVLGSLVKLARLVNTAQPVVVKQGTNTILADNYRVYQGGIWINPTQTGTSTQQITAGTAITVDYTPLASSTIESLIDTAGEYELYFDGLNEARSGRAVVVTAHRVKFSPAKNLSLIGDDFASLDLDFQALADTTITAAGRSQYFKVEMAA